MSLIFWLAVLFNSYQLGIYPIWQLSTSVDKYNISNISDKQALADIMIMLYIHPTEIKNLRIANGSVTGYAKNRGQQNILQVFRSLKKNEK